MSVSQQLSNKSFFNLIAAIRQTELNDILNEETINGMVYSSIYNFNISDINDNVCMNPTSDGVISDKEKKRFNPLHAITLREPSISSDLETLSPNKCNIIKSELYTSIRNPGVEASIQPKDTSYINPNFIKEGETINILNPQSTLKLPSEFRSHIYENTKQLNQQTPYCIVYGTFTPNNKLLYHVSAAIVYNGHLYPFGWTNEKVLDNPRDKTVRPVQAVLVSPETINPRWNYFIIDILLVTNDMLSKIESFFDKSTLKTAVDLYLPYTTGPAKRTIGVTFGENHLYVDTARYMRISNNFTQVCFGYNCSSWIEYIFGINCRLFSLAIMPSIPNYCKRAGYKTKFKVESLTDIIQSIRTNNFSRFFQLINNVKSKTKLSSFGLKSDPPPEQSIATVLDTDEAKKLAVLGLNPDDATITSPTIDTHPAPIKKTRGRPKNPKTLTKKLTSPTNRKTRTKRHAAEVVENVDEAPRSPATIIRSSPELIREIP